MSLKRWTVKILQVLLATLVLVYVVDWVTARVRMRQGTAFQSIQVRQLLATPLKGQKEEFDFTGDVEMTCSRSIFPQADNPPCWWLRRHTTQWE